MCEWTEWQLEPTLSIVCCAGPDPYRPIRQFQFRVIGIIYNGKFNMLIKAGHSPSHSTDFSRLRLLPPTGPSQSGVSYIERRSVSNPGSHYRESSALPTELRDGQERDASYWSDVKEAMFFNWINTKFVISSLCSIDVSLTMKTNIWCNIKILCVANSSFLVKGLIKWCIKASLLRGYI